MGMETLRKGLRICSWRDGWMSVLHPIRPVAPVRRASQNRLVTKEALSRWTACTPAHAWPSGTDGLKMPLKFQVSVGLQPRVDPAP